MPLLIATQPEMEWCTTHANGVVAALRSTHNEVREVAMTTLRESIRVNSDEQAQDWSHVRGFGWRPQLPDVRDKLYATRLTGLPPSEYDLRPSMPPVYDQGQLGSCTGNAIAGAMEYERDRQGLTDFVPSRLFIYYNERALEGTVSSDSGAVIRDGIKVVNREGVCPETLWPYDIGVFTVKPPQALLRVGRDG